MLSISPNNSVITIPYKFIDYHSMNLRPGKTIKQSVIVKHPSIFYPTIQPLLVLRYNLNRLKAIMPSYRKFRNLEWLQKYNSSLKSIQSMYISESLSFLYSRFPTKIFPQIDVDWI